MSAAEPAMQNATAEDNGVMAEIRNLANVAASVEEGVIAALRTVRDPEIPLNIYDLGLIYRIDLGAHEFVGVDMTLTAPGCPVAGDIVASVKAAVEGVEGVTAAIVNLVFDPPWTQERMSEAARLELGLI